MLIYGLFELFGYSEFSFFLSECLEGWWTIFERLMLAGNICYPPRGVFWFILVFIWDYLNPRAVPVLFASGSGVNYPIPANWFGVAIFPGLYDVFYIFYITLL